jgi:hypothetical protein
MTRLKRIKTLEAALKQKRRIIFMVMNPKKDVYQFQGFSNIELLIDEPSLEFQSQNDYDTWVNIMEQKYSSFDLSIVCFCVAKSMKY